MRNFTVYLLSLTSTLLIGGGFAVGGTSGKVLDFHKYNVGGWFFLILFLLFLVSLGLTIGRKVIEED